MSAFSHSHAVLFSCISTWIRNIVLHKCYGNIATLNMQPAMDNQYEPSFSNHSRPPPLPSTHPSAFCHKPRLGRERTYLKPCLATMAGRGRELTMPAWMKKQQLQQGAAPQLPPHPTAAPAYAPQFQQQQPAPTQYGQFANAPVRSCCQLLHECASVHVLLTLSVRGYIIGACVAHGARAFVLSAGQVGDAGLASRA